MSQPPKRKQRVQRIKVYVRLRPTEECVPSSFEYFSSTELVIKDHSKHYRFDQVFGPSSSQLQVYKSVVFPLITEVLGGYNCTVFAYGQTGSGKTHTMIGDIPKKTFCWQDDNMVGCVSRAAHHLYDELHRICDENTQITVTVSFIELYNEEVRDLLKDGLDVGGLRIYEDKNKSAKIKNLTEETVLCPDDIIFYLKKGCDKRQSASTLMNINSSRSHTVFTINVSTINGIVTDSIFCGKLNLVDLAGSENIGKSGAKDTRAREAGNINQSLLTLGRVIKALGENAPHVPYRESKLTRILQDSLGGKTKTCIIATVSPVRDCMDETISTLEYASGARNITICPTINIKSTNAVQELTDQLVQLKKDLMASASQHGIYMDKENYENIQTKLDTYKKNCTESNSKIKMLKEELKKIAQAYDLEKSEWENLQRSFEITRNANRDCQLRLQQQENAIKEEKLVAEFFEKRVSEVSNTAASINQITNMLRERDAILQTKVTNLFRTSAHNQEVTNRFLENVQSRLKRFEEIVNTLEVSPEIDHLIEVIKSGTKDIKSSVYEQLRKRAEILQLEAKNLEGEESGNLLQTLMEKKEDLINACNNIHNSVNRLHKDILHVVNENQTSYIHSLSKLEYQVKDKTTAIDQDYHKSLQQTNNIIEDVKTISTSAKLHFQNMSTQFTKTSNHMLNQISTQMNQMFKKIVDEMTTEMSNKMTQMSKQMFSKAEQDVSNYVDEILQHGEAKVSLLTQTYEKQKEDWTDFYQTIQKEKAALQDVDQGQRISEVFDSFNQEIEENTKLESECFNKFTSETSKVVANILNNVATENLEMNDVLDEVNNINLDTVKTSCENIRETVCNSKLDLQAVIDDINRMVPHEYTKKITPIQHYGDTPQRQIYKTPTNLPSCPSRQSVISRLRAEGKLRDEDDLSASPCGISNISDVAPYVPRRFANINTNLLEQLCCSEEDLELLSTTDSAIE